MFDAIIVGSDQIWRPCLNENIENSYLAFATNWNIKRVAYATSFGTNEWEYTKEETSLCRYLVSLFNDVSVREDSGIELCKEYLGVNAIHVLDPTMLLGSDTYINLFKNSNTQLNKGNLFSYVLDPKEEINSFISKLSKNEGLIHFMVNSRVEEKDAPLNEKIQPPVEQWLRGFYDANLVVTDSFHACVFAMIFKKPFVVFKNIGRGCARFDSLLKMFDQEYRVIEKYDDYVDRKELIMSIPDIDNKLTEMQRISLNFLEKNIKL
jgi:Polysaccharide pyruvyl transferase.